MYARSGVYVAAMVAVLALSACVSTTKLQQEEVRDPTPGDGVVIGTVVIRGGKDILGRTKWELAARSTDPAARSAAEYVIDVHRDGAEELFVTTMPAGGYQVYELRQTAFSNFRMQTNVVFQVQPGRATYIGRLAVDFPQALITIYTPVRLSVENSKETAVADARTRYRRPFVEVATDLMAIGRASPSKLPGESTANELLEKDTVFMLMTLDGAEDAGCRERHVVAREIVSASATGAVERWTLARCSKPVRYRITFSPSARGGTDIGAAIER